MTTITDALRAARACIQQDRTSLADTGMRHDNTMEPDAAAGVAEYDAVLQQIDAALAAPQGEPVAKQAEPFGWYYRINNTFDAFELGAEPPPDDAYDDGTLVALYTTTQPAPGTAREFVEWVKAQPEDRDPTTIDGALAEFEAQVSLKPQAPAVPCDPTQQVRPYEPTEQMRWAMKRIDPALTHDQCRALWSAAWTAAIKKEQ